ncbi:Hypothetical protein LUCI_3261 [Lucifera butyrica]|uniref:CobQ/CobB/MinD/ParA nucleotide binding domain-containing protein n=1 Tax=Lucifera butyrica TaxID=1351585 RepID=A0A498R5J7_9FIRM|nr:tyrosine-protein kinase family protein [Lucifera butyrica]VBB07996.1 Hypothetical protein LUCI_3261 [Lucifera butyrica]
MDMQEQLAGQKRIAVFVGEFGSGKTEVSVNYAVQLKRAGFKTAIVDMDLVKPYFRTRENRDLLEQQHIRVSAADNRLANADLPVLPSELNQLLYDEDYQVVIDVGGSEAAIVLGRFQRQLAEVSYAAMMVINIYRPFSQTVEDIVAAIDRIQKTARISISGLISNANLAAETTAEHIYAGISLVEKVVEKTGIPIMRVVIPQWLQQEITTKYPVLLLERYTHYPYME